MKKEIVKPAEGQFFLYKDSAGRVQINALDDDRLKNGNKFDKAYFRDLLDRIKDIRTSERMLYQQLKDIYALSADY